MEPRTKLGVDIEVDIDVVKSLRWDSEAESCGNKEGLDVFKDSLTVYYFHVDLNFLIFGAYMETDFRLLFPLFLYYYFNNKW